MEILFSTNDVHPRVRFAWQDVACRNFVKHESRPVCRSIFQAAIQTRPVRAEPDVGQECSGLIGRGLRNKSVRVACLNVMTVRISPRR